MPDPWIAEPVTESSEERVESVGRVDDIPENGGLVVEVAGESIAVFGLDDGYYALTNVCPHQGGPLGDGKVEDECVYCPWHGHQFDIRTGEHGQMSQLDCQTYEVEQRGDELFVHL